jgi:hypothetical protein
VSTYGASWCWKKPSTSPPAPKVRAKSSRDISSVALRTSG